MHCLPTPTRDVDPHRKTVYAWEDTWPQSRFNLLTFKQCRALVGLICKAYKVPSPRLKQHHRRSMSWVIPADGLMSIQGGAHGEKGGRNLMTVCHEMAHWVLWQKHGERPQDHGPVFQSIYLSLCVKAGVAPRIALEASARFGGLRW